MTERLYYADPYMRNFSAQVSSCAKTQGGFEVVLDRTAFYPEGGGQPGDRGRIGGVAVLDTQERDGEVLHLCQDPIEIGTSVEGEIDWQRRFDLMQQHSGEHMVSGIIHALYGYNNVGFHMGSEIITIDLSGEMDAQQIREVERIANEAIWADEEVEISYPDEDTLRTLPYRSKKELTGEVRIVKIGQTDLCACCGTHVRRTGEIGLIKLLSFQKFREGVRIEMLSGRRAYEYVSAIVEQNHENVTLLSAKPLETSAAVQRLQAELAAEKYRRVGIREKLHGYIAKSHAGDGDVLIFEDELEGDELRRLADAVAAHCGGLCSAFSGNDEKGYKYALIIAEGDIRDRVKAMNAALNGRGGGRANFAQGSVNCTKADIERYFAGE